MAAAILALFVVATTAYRIFADLEAAIAEAARDAQNARLVAENGLVKTIADIDRALRAAARLRAEVEAGGPSDRASIHSALKAIDDSSPTLTGIGWTDAGGNRLHSSVFADPPPLNIADQAHFRVFQETADNREIYIGTPIRSRVDGSWVIAVARRYLDKSGQFDGIVIGILPPQKLLPDPQILNLGSAGVIGLLTESAILMAREPAREDFLGQSMAHTPVGRMALRKESNDNRTYRVGAIDGVKRIYSYGPVAGTGFFVLTAVAYDDALASFAKGLPRELAMSFLILAALGLGATIIGRQVRRREALIRDLRSAEERFYAFMDNCPITASYKDSEGRLLYYNPAYEKVLGFAMLEARSKSIYEKASMVEPDKLRAVDAALLADAPPMRVDVPVDHPEGRRIWSSFRFSFRDRDGQKLLGSMAYDVTERQEMEARLRQSQKMEAIGQLTAGIAHDFNNLLQVILGNLELTRLRTADKTVSREIAAAFEAARRGATLTRQLLAFGRRTALQPEPTDVSVLIDKLIALLHRTLGEPVEIVPILPAGLPATLVDHAQLENALINLVLNARDAMPRGGRLTVETSAVKLGESRERIGGHQIPSGHYVMIAVTDTGAGMTAEVQARVFEPFFTTKGVGKGSGLGLSMVYGFVKQSGGHVEIDSQPGRGTTVELYFPAHRAVEPAEAASVKPQAETMPMHVSSTRKQILIIEDQPDVGWTVITQLAALGYEAQHVTDGLQALAVIEGGAAVDLLLCDLILPGPMTGLETAKAIRTLRPGIKTVFMSGHAGYAQTHDRKPALTGQLLQKPVGQQDLAHALAREFLTEGA